MHTIRILFPPRSLTTPAHLLCTPHSHIPHPVPTCLSPTLPTPEHFPPPPPLSPLLPGLTPEQLPASTIPPLLKKMMLDASLSSGGDSVVVSVPITRPDVMHACDVMEDVAVSYSYAKIPRMPAPVMCTGKQQLCRM